jgi:glycolate oxidase
VSITLDSPLIPRLRESLPDDALLTDPDSLVAYATDSAPFAEPGAAAVVALPSNADQVTHILRTAHALGIPVVPQGARTGLAGAGNAIDGCVVLSTERMNRIVEIDPANRFVRCQPGVVAAALDAAVGEFGLCYPPDPASHRTCTVGGNIATGAGGLCCVKYGVTADYVLGLELALIDGRTLRVGHRTVKGVAGYDLTRLIVGSEGTLAVILEATLALRPRRAPGLALLAEFPDLASAGAAVAAIIAAGQIPSALELLDRATSRAIADYGHPLMSGESAATLIVESESPDAKSDLETITEICHLSGASKVTAATARRTRVRSSKPAASSAPR